jgi:hypothetical protein
MRTMRLIFGRYGIIHLVCKNSKKENKGFFETMWEMLDYAETSA